MEARLIVIICVCFFLGAGIGALISRKFFS